MGWNLQSLRIMRVAMTRSHDGASAVPLELSWSARRQLLAVFRRHAAVLHLTADLARTAGKLEQHAAFGATLAILQARVQARETSRALAVALAEFARRFDAFITAELGYRSA